MYNGPKLVWSWVIFMDKKLDDTYLFRDDEQEEKLMKKCFIFGVVFTALEGVQCFGDYVAQDFISPKTNKSAVFWGDASKGKDAYVLEYDEASQKYYFEKVEKNKPEAKKNEANSTQK